MKPIHIKLCIIAFASVFASSCDYLTYTHTLSPDDLQRYNVSLEQLKGVQVYLGSWSEVSLDFQFTSSNTDYSASTNSGEGHFTKSGEINNTIIDIPSGTPGVIVGGNLPYSLEVDFGDGALLEFDSQDVSLIDPLVGRLYALSTSQLTVGDRVYTLENKISPGGPVYYLKSSNSFLDNGTKDDTKTITVPGKTVY